MYIYIAAFLFCNAAVSLPVVLKSICGADECHQIFSGADEYQWCWRVPAASWLGFGVHVQPNVRKPDSLVPWGSGVDSARIPDITPA